MLFFSASVGSLRGTADRYSSVPALRFRRRVPSHFFLYLRICCLWILQRSGPGQMWRCIFTPFSFSFFFYSPSGSYSDSCMPFLIPPSADLCIGPLIQMPKISKLQPFRVKLKKTKNRLVNEEPRQRFI